MGLKGLGNVKRQLESNTPSISLDADAHPTLRQDSNNKNEWVQYGLITSPQPIGDPTNSSADPWVTLTLSIIRQSLKDAEQGDHDALLWLINEGRALLDKLGIPKIVVDNWAANL